MKLFVLEYACAGGEGGEPYLKEGGLMLRVLLSDLARHPSCHVSTLVSPDYDSGGLEADEITALKGDFLAGVSHRMDMADAVWIVAPESGKALYRLVAMAEAMGKKVLAPGSSAVELCGDKLKLFRRFSGNLPTPYTEVFSGRSSIFPCVIKPVDGAGSEDVFLVANPTELAPVKKLKQGYILQPYVEGEAMSAAIVSHMGGFEILGVCRQRIAVEGKMKVVSIEGPVDFPWMDSLSRMVSSILKMVPGLRGYWGVDFVRSDEGITLIEVNPRLTTSYLNYSASSPVNIAGLVIDRVYDKLKK